MNKQMLCSAARPVVLALGLASLSTWALAQAPQAFITGNGKTVTSADVQADSQRMPDDARAGYMANTKIVQELSTNLYVRRVMAERGRQAGVDKSDEMQAAIQIAVDKIVSDAYLKKFDAEHKPSDKAITDMAKAQYQAEKAKFAEPERVRAAHILISGDSAESKAKAEKLLKELKGGANFATVAKANSEDPGSAVKGGDLGTFSRGRMVPEFEAAVFGLAKPGDLSGLVKSQFGYHIIKLEEKLPAKQLSYAEVESKLKEQATNELVQKARTEAVKELTEKMTVNKDAIEAFSKQYEAQAKTQAK